MRQNKVIKENFRTRTASSLRQKILKQSLKKILKKIPKKIQKYKSGPTQSTGTSHVSQLPQVDPSKPFRRSQFLIHRYSWPRLHWAPPSSPRQRIPISDPGAHCAPPLLPRHPMSFTILPLYLYSYIFSLLTHPWHFLSLISFSLISLSFYFYFFFLSIF